MLPWQLAEIKTIVFLILIQILVSVNYKTFVSECSLKVQNVQFFKCFSFLNVTGTLYLTILKRYRNVIIQCSLNILKQVIFKGIVHFEIKMWYLSAYPKGIQDVGVFFSSVDPILMFLGQTVLVCQSYNGRYRSLSL